MWEAGLRPGKALLKDGQVQKVVKRGLRTLKAFTPVSAIPAEALSNGVE